MLRDVCCLLQSHQQLPKWEMRQHCSTPTPAQALGLTPLHDPASPADALDASMAMPACAKGAGAAPARHASHCSVSSMKDMMMAAAAQVSWQPCWHVVGLWPCLCTREAHLQSFARVCPLHSVSLAHKQQQLHNNACRRPTGHSRCEDTFPEIFSSFAQMSWQCLQSCSASLLR